MIGEYIMFMATFIAVVLVTAVAGALVLAIVIGILEILISIKRGVI